MKNRKITKHAKMRIKERSNRNKYSTLLNTAIHKGNSKEKYDKGLYLYLYRKAKKNARVIVFSDYIFIISKTGKTLITMYPVPKRFRPAADHLILNSESSVLYNINWYLKRKVKIKLKTNVPIYGKIISAELSREGITRNIVVQTNYNIEVLIDANDIKSIKFDKNEITDELYNYFSE